MIASLPCTIAGGLEAGEGERLHILIERHAILQAKADRDGEIVHQAAESGAFLVHVDEDFAQAPVLELAGAEIDLVAADDRLLGIALAAVRQLLALGGEPHALDDALDDALGDDLGAPALGSRGNGVRVFAVLGEELRGKRLRELGAVAVERVRLKPQLPRQHVGFAAFGHRRRIRHVDGLRDRARDERLGGGEHVDMALPGERALAAFAAWARAIEHGKMLRLEARRAFERHRSADILVRGFDLGLREADCRKQVEARRVHRFRRQLQARRCRNPRRASTC